MAMASIFRCVVGSVLIHLILAALSTFKVVAPEKVLVLDVDGTLYGDKAGIEQQIVQNIYSFVRSKYGLSSDECDLLHFKYGSTIQGLQQEGRMSQEDLEEFYREVYVNIDYTALQGPDGNEGDATGYSHSTGWKNLLRALPYPKYIASNSPRPHIQKVLASLGLEDVEWLGILTPDMTRKFWTKTEREYWNPILERHTPNTDEIVLIDDSTTNIEAASSFGVDGVQITKHSSIEQALCSFIGAIPKPNEWQFSSLDYLKSKNVEDNRAMSQRVWERVLHEVGQLQSKPIVIYDLGAGLLNMLKKFLDSSLGQDVYYTAFETEAICMEENLKWLVSAGFERTSEEMDVFEKVHKGNRFQVTLRKEDFTNAKLVDEKPDVIVGCCLADLFQPEMFVSSVLRLAQGSPCLVYLPISFAGQTDFFPSSPQSKKIPSDQTVMKFYHESLEKDHRHNLLPTKLMDAFKLVGAAAIAQESSNWVVNKKENACLWKSLLYFFGLNTSYRMLTQGYDVGQWIERVQEKSPVFEVSNVDFLFKMSLEEEEEEEEAKDLAASTESTQCLVKEGQYVEFIGPKKVHVATEEINVLELAPNEILIQTECSLISSGTEVKIFKGEFDDTSVLDTNFASDEDMSYPLRYGYSLAGKVIACGSEVDEPEKLMGQLVFTFASHQSLVVADAASVMLVPEGISAEDAVYLPAVETALSLVQHANPPVGENIAVVGQGMIGLLVTAILAKVHKGVGGGKLIALDMVPERLAVARRLGATDVSSPVSFADNFGKVDMTIDLTGSMKGLQFAIDHTGYGGTVVIGSWYGNQPTPLSLGLDFHRSHIKIIASQVSNIPAELSDRWTKSRRFDSAWKLVQLLCPSKYITTSIRHISSAQSAYESLEIGQELGVQFVFQNFK